MYSLNGNYTLENGDILVGPQWEYVGAYDNAKEMKASVMVRFITEGYVPSDRFLLTLDYSQKGTYEDQDCIDAILALPEFCNSTEI